MRATKMSCFFFGFHYFLSPVFKFAFKFASRWAFVAVLGSLLLAGCGGAGIDESSSSASPDLSSSTATSSQLSSSNPANSNTVSSSNLVSSTDQISSPSKISSENKISSARQISSASKISSLSKTSSVDRTSSASKISNSTGAVNSSKASASSRVNNSSSFSSSALAELACTESIKRGKVLYETTKKCALCHGDNAVSGASKAIDLKAETYRHSTMKVTDLSLSLSAYIAAYMPGPGNCTGLCATDISAHLRNMAGRPACAKLNSSQSSSSVVSVIASNVYTEPLHRLNRLEYNNTMRDLLGVDLKLANKFPTDGALMGFDNIAEGLPLSPSLFDLYFTAAGTLVEAALDQAPVFSLSVPPISGSPRAVKVGNSAALRGNIWSTKVKITQAGKYKVSLAISGYRTTNLPDDSTFTYVIDNAVIRNGTTTGTFTQPEVITTELDWAAGDHNITIEHKNFFEEAAANKLNELTVSGFDVVSLAQKQPAAGNLVFICDVVKAGCYDQIIDQFTRRAFRRAPTSAELTAYKSLFKKMASAEGNVDALKLTFRAILTSPHFLYRAVKASDVTHPKAINSYVLASRLSYFLWSSMPDDELLAAAEKGSLATDAELLTQVRRLLKSPKVIGLSDGFAEQWLALRLLKTTAPSAAIFPEFDENLRTAMVAESKLFFNDYITNNLDLKTMTNPDFGYLNTRLAEHYGMADPKSNTMVRVALKGEQRRGLLELSAWLTAMSDTVRTSPVRRGNWLLGQTLCNAVPPPPASVVTSLPEGSNLSIQEQLKLHRSDASCAKCHNSLDPAGLGFEQFNGVGKLLPVMSSGALEGIDFGSPRDLANQLAATSDVKECVADKMFRYALGRQQQKTDPIFLEAVVQQHQKGRGTLPELIEAIVLSPAFRATPTVTDFSANTPSSTWMFCANENQVCRFVGTKRVRYGAGSTWAERPFTESVECNNATFGDPIANTLKTCEVSGN